MTSRFRPHLCALLAAALIAPAATSLADDTKVRASPAATKAGKDALKPKIQLEPSATPKKELAPARSKAKDVRPDAAAEVDTGVMKPKVPTKPAIATDAAKKGLKLMLPDLQVSFIDPVSTGAPLKVVVTNKGKKATPQGFTVVTEPQLSCEVGKLVSPITAVNGEANVGVLAVNASATINVYPQSGTWGGGGCYVRAKARADSWGIIAESNEDNNQASTQWCPGSGSCY